MTPKEVLKTIQSLFGDRYRYITQDADGTVCVYIDKPRYSYALEEWDGSKILLMLEVTDIFPEGSDASKYIYPKPELKMHSLNGHIDYNQEYAFFKVKGKTAAHDLATLKTLVQSMENATE